MSDSTGLKHNRPECGSFGVKVPGAIDKGHPGLLSSGGLPTACPQGIGLHFPSSFPHQVINCGKFFCCPHFYWLRLKVSGPSVPDSILDRARYSPAVDTEGEPGGVAGARFGVDGSEFTSWSARELDISGKVTQRLCPLVPLMCYVGTLLPTS